MKQYRDRFEHHLLLKMSGPGIDEARTFLTRFFSDGQGDFFICSADEGKKAFLHRFAAAGAAVRYHAVHEKEVEDILALDIALRRNDRDWFETLPEDIDNQLVAKTVLRPFHVPRFSSGLHRQKRREQQGTETPDA